MTFLVLFMLAVIVPAFFASPQSIPLWLSAQAIALAGYGASTHGLHSWNHLGAIASVLILRGVVGPLLLARAPGRSTRTGHLIPPNLFGWVLGISVVVLGFEFAFTAAPSPSALTLGAVCASVALALLTLSLNEDASAQLFGLLLLENAGALFESTLKDPWSGWVHGALACVYVLTVGVAVQLSGHQEDHSAADAPRHVL